MNELKDIKVIAFDYGGTLDLPGMHWFDFLWELVQTQLSAYIPVTREEFWDAYVYGERELERLPIPSDTDLFNTLFRKSRYEIDYLSENVPGFPAATEDDRKKVATLLATSATVAIKEGTYKESDLVLSQLYPSYQIYIVSNFYGNLQTILTEAGFMKYITTLIDSTVVGVRKPDPAIWQLAINASGLRPEQILVVGDSMKNDIQPGELLGCRTLWLTKEAPGDYPGVTIQTLSELPALLGIK